MAKGVGGLFFSLSASAAKFADDMSKARAAAKKSGQGIERGYGRAKKASKSLSKSLSRLKMSIIAVAGPAALGLLVKRSLDTADAIAKTADAAGLSTDSLQELGHAAKLSGVSSDSLNSALMAFSKRVGEARAGTGTLVTILNKMNPSLLENVKAAKDTDEAFNLVVEAAAGMSSQLDRAALFSAAFGRTAGVEMTNLLRDGTDGLNAMRQEARDLGLIIDEDLLRSSEAANDALTRLSSVLGAKLTVTVANLAPEIEQLATNILDALPDILKFVTNVTTAIGLVDKTQRQMDEDKLVGVTKQYVKATNELTKLNRELARIEERNSTIVLSNGEVINTMQAEWEKTVALIEEKTALREELDAQIAALKGLERAQNDANVSTVSAAEKAKRLKEEINRAVEGLEKLKQGSGETSQFVIDSMEEIPDATDDSVSRQEKAYMSLFSDVRGAYDQFWSSLASRSMTGADRLDAIFNSLLQAILRHVGDMVLAWAAAEAQRVAATQAANASIKASNASTSPGGGGGGGGGGAGAGASFLSMLGPFGAIVSVVSAIAYAVDSLNIDDWLFGKGRFDEVQKEKAYEIGAMRWMMANQPSSMDDIPAWVRDSLPPGAMDRGGGGESTGGGPDIYITFAGPVSDREYATTVIAPEIERAARMGYSEIQLKTRD